MRSPFYWIVLFVLFCSSKSLSNENGKPFITNYSSKVYGGHTQNWAIEQDSNGIMYFGNQAGVLTFDGYNWRVIEINNHSTVRSLAKSPDGTIYVGAVGELGYLAPDYSGKMQFNSLKHKIDSSLHHFSNVWNTCTFNNKVYFLTDNYLFCYDGKSFTHFKKEGAYFYSCFVVNAHLFVHDYQFGLKILKGDSLALIPNGSNLANEAIHGILPVDSNHVLIASKTKGLIQIDFINGVQDIKNYQLRWYAKQKQLYHAVKLSNGYYALGTIQNGIIIVDQKGNLKEIINKSSGLIDETIYYLYEADGVLWCALEKGIAKIEYSEAFRYWDETTGLQGSISDIVRFENKLFVSTGGGLFSISEDSLPETSLFVKDNMIQTQTWDLEIFNNKLLIGTGHGLHVYENGKTKRLLRGKGIYKIFSSQFHLNRIYLAQENKISYIDYNPKTRKFDTEATLIHAFVSEVRDIIEDDEGTIWLAINYVGTAKVCEEKKQDSTQYKIKIYGNNEGIQIDRQLRLYKIKQNILFASDIKIFNYNELKDRFYPDSLFYDRFKILLGRQLIYSNLENKHWINSKYIVSLEDSLYHTDSMLLKRFPDVNTELHFIEAKNKTWVGTAEGLYLINDTAHYHLPKAYKTIIRKVETKNDSIIFWGNGKLSNTIKIAHPTNFIGFHFSAPFFINENKVQYSYLLEGYDNQWSDWSYENKKEFTNLFEGKYTFKVKAKNYLGMESKIDEFSFTISAPLFRTLWAYLIYAILLMAVISIIVLLRTRKLRKDKIKLEKIIQSRTQEIINQKNQVENVANKLAEANKELEKLSIIAKKSDNAVAVFDREGNIEWINEGFTRMYGYTLEQFIAERGKNLFGASENPNITETIKKCIESKETTIYQYFTITRDGEGLWAQTTLTPLIDSQGKLDKLIAIDTNITKLKDAEQKIENQRDELKNANENKDKLFSIIAHDLRGPLSNIFAILNIIYHDIDVFNKEELKNIISQLKETTGNTFNLTENLLDWAHLRRDNIKYNPRYVNICDLIQENVELFSSQASKKEILLENLLKGSETVYADEEMVKTILRNLMGNAIKFTGKQGKISLSTSYEQQNCWVHVSDTGKGMEPWEIDRLFKIEQPHTTLGTEKEKGSGLGLILAKEFVEKNKGSIRIKSNKGLGSTFSFCLPISEL